MDKAALRIKISEIYSLVLGRSVGELEMDARLSDVPETVGEHEYVASLLHELLRSEEYSKKRSPNSSFVNVHDEDVFFAYKFFLGRLPENRKVYEDKRKKNSLSELLEEIVTSEEFKMNSVLKGVLSPKRKPHGFDRYAKSEELSKKSKILVISGCQGKMLADLFQAYTGVSAVPNIFLSASKYNEFLLTKGKEYGSELEGYDYIFTQKYEVHKILQANPDLSSKVRLLPLIEFTGFQPDQCYLNNRQTNRPVLGPLGEYQSNIVTAAYFAGLNVAETRHCFTPAVFEKFGFYSLSKQSKDALIAQQQVTGYPLAEFITQWDASGKWMRTVNHPKKYVLSTLVRHALALEGISAIHAAEEFVYDDLSANVDWPLYPAINEEGSGLEGFDFKLPKAFAPHANAALFLSVNSFIDYTFLSLEGLTAEDVHCHQLGRSINLTEQVEWLRNNCRA